MTRDPLDEQLAEAVIAGRPPRRGRAAPPTLSEVEAGGGAGEVVSRLAEDDGDGLGDGLSGLAVVAAEDADATFLEILLDP